MMPQMSINLSVFQASKFELEDNALHLPLEAPSHNEKCGTFSEQQTVLYACVFYSIIDSKIKLKVIFQLTCFCIICSVTPALATVCCWYGL